MRYECNCTQLTKEQWEQKMKGLKPISYKWLVTRIKKHIPQLYEDLCLESYNPYANMCGVNQDYYVLVHSAIEYFIMK